MEHNTHGARNECRREPPQRVFAVEAKVDLQRAAERNSSESLADRVDELIRQAKLDRKEALKLAAKERGLTKRAAYNQLHVQLREPES